MKGIVYKIIFNDRKRKGKMPFQYIGSKTNFRFVDDKIFCLNKGKFYYGSVSSNQYKLEYNNSLENEIPSIEILEYSNSINIKIAERKWQLYFKCVESPEYFNKVLANPNSNFDKCGYSSVKHHITGKTLRLPKDHELIKDGTYVGVSKGIKNENLSKALKGKSYKSKGKKFSQAHKDNISLSKIGRPASNRGENWLYENELYNLWIENDKPNRRQFLKIAISKGFPDCSYHAMIDKFKKVNNENFGNRY